MQWTAINIENYMGKVIYLCEISQCSITII